MKRSFKTFVSHIFLLSLSLGISQAQVNTDLETTVVDVLAQLPTENLEHSDRLMREVMALGDTGILEFTSRLVPAGAGNDAEARYLVHSLAVYAGREVTPEERQLVESTFQKAIAEENDPEVKRFLLERLTFVATDRSVGFVSDYLGDPEYYQSALSVLESIGTQTAASAVYKELSGAEGERQYAIVASLGELRYLPANESLIAISDTPDWVSVKYVLWSLSEIASEESYKTLVKAASTGKYRMDTKEGVNALLNYGLRLRETGNKSLSQDVGKTLMKRLCKNHIFVACAFLHNSFFLSTSIVSLVFLTEHEQKPAADNVARYIRTSLASCTQLSANTVSDQHLGEAKGSISCTTVLRRESKKKQKQCMHLAKHQVQ